MRVKRTTKPGMEHLSMSVNSLGILAAPLTLQPLQNALHFRGARGIAHAPHRIVTHVQNKTNQQLN